jgi:hypothetical protein
MYLMPEMIDMGLRKGETWATPDHRLVAQNILLGNRLVRTMDSLQEAASIINAIPKADIVKVTANDLRERGIPIP